jgi:phytoene dehydrogenase-like protein
LFSAYPAARRHLSFSRLDLKPFTPGAIIARDGKLYPVADPLRATGLLTRSLTMPLFGLGDKLRTVALARSTRRTATEAIFAEADQPTEQYLRGRGFSPGFIDNFARPFYGGIFLDRALDTSSAMFRFTYKMLSMGETVLPAKGMQEIPDQLARALPTGAIHYGLTVEGITYERGLAVGVQTQDGQQIPAQTVVIATDPATAARLLENPGIPHQPVSCRCVYFASPTSFYDDQLIVLNANPQAYVNHLAQIDNIAPAYAPARQHLLALTVLGAGDEGDEQIEQRCRDELALLFPGKPLDGLRLLRIFHIPFAQFAQPPGIYRSLPTTTTATANIFLASEVTHSSSIQGAMESGEHAARLILEGPPATAPAANRQPAGAS